MQTVIEIYPFVSTKYSVEAVDINCSVIALQDENRTYKTLSYFHFEMFGLNASARGTPPGLYIKCPDSPSKIHEWEIYTLVNATTKSIYVL